MSCIYFWFNLSFYSMFFLRRLPDLLQVQICTNQFRLNLPWKESRWPIYCVTFHSFLLTRWCQKYNGYPFKMIATLKWYTSFMNTSVIQKRDWLLCSCFLRSLFLWVNESTLRKSLASCDQREAVVMKNLVRSR